MATLIKSISDPNTYLAFKRVCEYVVNDAWHISADFEFEYVVTKTKQYNDDVQKLANADLDIGWGDKKEEISPGTWATKHAGDFNPWYDGTLTLEEFLESIEPLAENIESAEPKQTAELEFLHYYEALRKALPKPEYSRPVAITLQSLHPKIQEHCTDLFMDGHYSDAILAACKVVFAELKLISGLDLEEFDLASRVMSVDNPIIKLNSLATKTGRNEQKGFMLLLQGLASGIRAPKAHDLIIQNDRHKALSYLAFASLLMQRIDERIAPPPQKQEHL